MNQSFKDKFNARLTNATPVASASVANCSTTVSPSRATPNNQVTQTVVRTEQVVKYQTNPIITLLLTVSIGLNILVLPVAYISWQFMGSPEYAVWVARNRTHVVLDENMVRRHEQYYKNVEQLLRNRK